MRLRQKGWAGLLLGRKKRVDADPNGAVDPSILVVGDVGMDWNMAIGGPHEENPSVSNVSLYHGGAIRVQRLLGELLETHQVHGWYVGRGSTKRNPDCVETLAIRHVVPPEAAKAADPDPVALTNEREKNPREKERGQLDKARVVMDSYHRFEWHPLSDSRCDADKLDSELVDQHKSMLKAQDREASADLASPDGAGPATEQQLLDFKVWRTLTKKNAWRASQKKGVNLREESGRGPISGHVSKSGVYLAEPGEVEAKKPLDVLVIIDAVGDAQVDPKGDLVNYAANKQQLIEKALELCTSQTWVIARCRYLRQDNADGNGPEGGPPWLDAVLKTKLPRTVIMTLADDWLGDKTYVSRGVSWEETGAGFAKVLKAASVVAKEANGAEAPKNPLTKAPWLVISLPYSGAVLHPRDAVGDEVELVYDSLAREGQWERTYPGSVPGKHTTVLAGLVSRCVRASDPKPSDRDKFTILKGLQLGLSAARYLRIAGYRDNRPFEEATELEFPYAEIENVFQKGEIDGNSVESKLIAEVGGVDKVRYPDRVFQHVGIGPGISSSWSILTERLDQSGRPGPSRPWPWEAIAERGLARSGLEVPLTSYGKLTVMGRPEVESYGTVWELIDRYLNRRTATPLSLGAFGPPGCGKSFAVKQLAASVSGDEVTVEVVEFNLSQMGSPKDLAEAFHVLRDKRLKGIVPLAFWDEFDCSAGEEFHWLRHFLAPMQDGVFRQEQLEHAIGKSVFVFAGGTRSTFMEFARGGSDPDLERRVKLPDFVSRIHGYLDVRGPNPVRPPGVASEQGSVDALVLEAIARRATLLHELLVKLFPELQHRGTKEIEIDPSVLRAFLYVPWYHHGARSMETIIMSSKLHDADKFVPSSLPPEEQLMGHVDGEAFMTLVNKSKTCADQHRKEFEQFRSAVKSQWSDPRNVAWRGHGVAGRVWPYPRRRP